LPMRSRANLKRIGMLALALLIALGALGTAYAAWTEDLYIAGTVNTGTLDIDIAGVSSTFVYKVPPGTTDHYFINGTEVFIYSNGTEVHYVPGAVDLNPPVVGTPVASAKTVDTSNTTGDVDSATMTFSGLFPDIDFVADLELEYLGSIPAKVSVAEIYATDDPGNKLESLWALGKATKGQDPRYGAWIDGELSVNDGIDWTYIDDPLGLQLHKYDLVHVTLHVNLPEEEQFQNLVDLGFTGIVTVIQWNEYED
jgi:hypothetical protein